MIEDKWDEGLRWWLVRDEIGAEVVVVRTNDVLGATGAGHVREGAARHASHTVHLRGGMSAGGGSE